MANIFFENHTNLPSNVPRIDCPLTVNQRILACKLLAEVYT